MSPEGFRQVAGIRKTVFPRDFLDAGKRIDQFVFNRLHAAAVDVLPQIFLKMPPEVTSQIMS